MKPGFGAQAMEIHAKRMMADPTWVMRWLWYKRVGAPPISFEDFTPAEMAAFLVGIDNAVENEKPGDTLSSGSGRWGPPRNLKLPSSWTEAVKTGDALIDKWEKEIAAGKTPDLSEGLSP